MALLFDDCVLQHRQLAAAFKGGWTMDTLYGHGWSNKQTLAKSGEREEVEGMLEGNWWSQFGQQSAQEFWRFAGTRAEDGNGGPKGEPFFFGPDWVSEDDLILDFLFNFFHRFQTLTHWQCIDRHDS